MQKIIHLAIAFIFINIICKSQSCLVNNLNITTGYDPIANNIIQTSGLLDPKWKIDSTSNTPINPIQGTAAFVIIPTFFTFASQPNSRWISFSNLPTCAYVTTNFISNYSMVLSREFTTCLNDTFVFNIYKFARDNWIEYISIDNSVVWTDPSPNGNMSNFTTFVSNLSINLGNLTAGVHKIRIKVRNESINHSNNFHGLNLEGHLISLYNSIVLESQTCTGYNCNLNPLISSFNYTFPSTCDSLHVQFNDASNSPSSIVSWNWNFGDIASGVNNTSNLQNPVHQFSAGGNYLVKLIVTNSQSISDTFSTNVQVNSNQFVVNAGNTLSLSCLTTSGTIGTTAIPGIIYSWSPTSGLNLSNVSQPIANPTASTIYTVTATNSVGCTATASVFVNVNMAPPFVDAGPIQYLTCITTNGVLGTTSIPGVSYNWLPASGLTVSNIAQPTASPTSTTIYTVTATNSYGCTSTSSVIVNVNNSPPLVNAGNGVNINCLTTSGTIGAAPVSGFSYSWVPSIGLNSSSISQPIANPPISTIYTVTATDGNGCIATSSVAVNVNNTPPYANAGLSKSLNCTDSSAMIGTVSVSGNTYSWAPISGLNSVNLAQPIASPTTNTIYTVTVTNSNGCTSTSTVLVTADKILPQANAGSDLNLTCNNTTGILGAIAIPGMTYHWAPSLGLTSATVAQPIANPTSSTVYTLTVIGANGCIANDNVSVNVLPLETIELSSDSTVCEGDVLAITATGGSSYLWSPPLGLNTTSGNFVICSTQQTTTYTIHYQDINGCEGWAQKTIYVHDTPSIVITKSNDIGCFQKSSQLAAKGANSFSWQPITGLNNANVSNPIASPFSTTVYTVTASNLFCSAQSAIEVHVDENILPDIFIPNSFSPNYDDVNDCFHVVCNQPLKNFKCKIYNRWGQLIFETQDPKQCWNGNYRNSDKPAPMETYFYLIEIQTNCGKTIKKGDITLLR